MHEEKRHKLKGSVVVSSTNFSHFTFSSREKEKVDPAFIGTREKFMCRLLQIFLEFPLASAL